MLLFAIQKDTTGVNWYDVRIGIQTNNQNGKGKTTPILTASKQKNQFPPRRRRTGNFISTTVIEN